MKPIEQLLGHTVGAISVRFTDDVAVVTCFNGMRLAETAFETTVEKGKAIQEWIDNGRPGLIQQALPQLTLDEREQCLSGITPEEWDEMFPEEESFPFDDEKAF